MIIQSETIFSASRSSRLRHPWSIQSALGYTALYVLVFLRINQKKMKKYISSYVVPDRKITRGIPTNRQMEVSVSKASKRERERNQMYKSDESNEMASGAVAEIIIWPDERCQTGNGAEFIQMAVILNCRAACFPALNPCQKIPSYSIRWHYPTYSRLYRGHHWNSPTHRFGLHCRYIKSNRQFVLHRIVVCRRRDRITPWQTTGWEKTPYNTLKR